VAIFAVLVVSGTAVAQKARPNVILISVDTLRADKLRSLSPDAPATPGIDKLLKGGTLFSQETSMVPLTLPSHAAMLTSTYPFVSGVEDNAETLAPGATTLAGTLRTSGYQTAAFLGSFVLDRRFGLDQGFNTWDSPAPTSAGSSTDSGDIKRKGEDVVKLGEAWLDQHSDRPFFLFLHLYDLHTPYNLSATEEARYGKGYDGELAYIDHALAGFQGYLEAHGLVDTSLIVFTSDHGEGLGDHGESTHGFFIYQSTLHVPLIIHWPAGQGHWPAGRANLPPRVDTPATLLDLAPTILNAVDVAVPKAMQGASVLGGASRDVWSETIYPQRHFGASGLTSLRRGHYKYIEAPRPEFYDLSEDPGEQHNLYASKAAVASAYKERLVQLRAQYQPQAARPATALSPEAVERLHALGYLTGTTSTPKAASSKVDPKDRIDDYESYGRAIVLASQGQVEKADALLLAILAKDPGLLDVRLTLGLDQQRLGKNAAALEQFRAVVAADPTSAIAHFDAGLSYFNLAQYDPAQRELQAALAISPGYSRAGILLAKTLGQKGALDQSAAEFQRVLDQSPNNAEAYTGLGTLAAMRGNWAESEKQLRASLTIEPTTEAHTTLGNVYLHTGKFPAAHTEFQAALALAPKSAAAHYNFGVTRGAQRYNRGEKRV
jgi:choline-sulfatase